MNKRQIFILILFSLLLISVIILYFHQCSRKETFINILGLPPVRQPATTSNAPTSQTNTVSTTQAPPPITVVSTLKSSKTPECSPELGTMIQLPGYNKFDSFTLPGYPKKVENYQMCNQLCLNTANCSATVYKPSEKLCNLKYNIHKTINRDSTENSLLFFKSK